MIQVAINEEDKAFNLPLNTLPLKTFAGVIGWSTRKLQSKIERGQFTEGKQFIKDPDGNVHIIIEGYNEWLQKGLVLKPVPTPSKSGSTMKAPASLKLSIGAPQRRL